jgi:ABC-type multidrug transport system fused ATPase/permease subunit
MISVVSQHTHLFNGTIHENLLVARPGASQDEIVAAARQAQIHTFIQGLPQDYDTWIGEQGLRLSGGERQRLALARAFLKDAPLLILDEPTANLDAITEREIMQSLSKLMAQRTTLLITHRLVGLEQMDTILVLEHGRVVEQGRHEDLLRLGRRYQHMSEQ